MKRIQIFIAAFFLFSIGIASAQYYVEVRVNVTPNSNDNSEVSLFVDGVKVYSHSNATLNKGEKIYSGNFTSSVTSVSFSFGSASTSSLTDTAHLVQGIQNQIILNTSVYGNYPYFNLYYATPNTSLLNIYNFSNKDIRRSGEFNYCGGEQLKIVHNLYNPINGNEYHEFVSKQSVTSTSILEHFYPETEVLDGNKIREWYYIVPSELSSRTFQARMKTYPGGNSTYTGWSNPSVPIQTYHARPKIKLLSTYADCSGAKRFVISITGAPIGASTGIQFYGLSGQYTTSNGAVDAIQFSGNTVKQIYSPGVYTFTGQDIPQLTAGSSVTLTGENWYQSVNNVCATSIVVPIPYPEFNFDNIISVTKAPRSNGLDVSCYGANDGRISFTGTNITSMSAVNDAGTVYPLTRNGNLFSKNDFYGGNYSMRITDNLGCESGYFYIFTITSPIEIKLTTSTRPLATCISNYQPAEIYCRILQASNNYNVSWLGYQYRYRLYKATNPTVAIYDISTPNTYVVFPNIYNTGTYIVDVEESRGCSITNSHQNVNITNGGNLALQDSVFGNYNGYNIRCNGQTNNLIFTFSGFNYNPSIKYTGVGLEAPPGSGNGRNIFTYRIVTTPGAGFIIITVDGVSAGNHVLYVNDDFNCNIIKSFILTEPQIPTISGIRTIIPNTCYGSTNAVYGYTVTGGVPPFNSIAIWYYATGGFLNYTVGVQSYPNHANTFTGLTDIGDNINGVMLGPDGNNCAYSSSSVFGYFNNYFPSPITFTASTTGVTCKGDRNGSLFPVSISGGNGRYFGKIYNSSFDSIPTGGQVYANNLPEDIYKIYVKDQKGCTITGGYLTATVTGPTMPLTITALGNVTQPSCYQSNNGELYFNATGGWPGVYTYQSLPSGHTNRGQTLTNNNTLPLKIGNASRGNYITSVTDSKGCKRSISSYLPSPDSMIVSVLNARQPNCFGANNGQFTLTSTGGNGIYRYSTLNNGIYKTSPVKDTLAAGTYLLSAKDNKNCLSGPATFVLTEPERLQAIIIDTLTAACHQSTGAVTIAGTGGTAPYQISWQDSVTYTAFRRDKMKSGIYRFYIKDSHNCRDSSTVALRDADGPKIIRSTLLSPTCSYSTDGRIKITVEEGSHPFTYDWSGGGTFQDSTAFNLAGNRTYSVLITDKYNCKGGMDFNLIGPTPLTMKVQNLHDPLCFGNNDGSIELISEGGSVPYQYFTNEGSPQSSNKISGLHAGVYQLITRDNHNCTVTGQAGLSEPDAYSFNFYPDNTIVCPGQKYKLQSPVISASYQWSGPNGFTASTERITTEKQGTYSLTVFNEKGCTATDDYLITESASILEANFLVKGEVSVGDTLVIVELSWPKPENISWNLPTQFTVVKTENEYAYVIPTEPGSYDISLEVALGDCSNERTKTVKILARDQAKKEDFTGEYLGPKLLYIYPNPAEGELNIYLEFGSETDVFMQVLDLSGTEVMRTQSLSGKSIYEEKLETSLLGSGMYIVKVNSPDYQRVVKFIKI